MHKVMNGRLIVRLALHSTFHEHFTAKHLVDNAASGVLSEQLVRRCVTRKRTLPAGYQAHSLDETTILGLDCGLRPIAHV